MTTILITGGTGYIGSHACVEVIEAGWTPVILDNLSNSSPRVVDRIERITGTRPAFVKADIRDAGAVGRLLSEHRIDAVVHFAGLKAVGESVADPLGYYQNNVSGTLTLLGEMKRFGVTRLVFSSSAAVYGSSARMPLEEAAPLEPASPYGRSKRMVEEVLRDLSAADPSWRTMALRYFNPVGAHPSALIGEDPRGEPNNLMPVILQVAVGRRKVLSIYGSDYGSRDGTGIRDYIHVVDLAKGHIAALRQLLAGAGQSFAVFNLGTGRGHTVLEVVRAFESVTGQKIPFRYEPRRPGDVDTCFAEVSAARVALDWQSGHSLEDMCRDAWKWQRGNPSGYDA